MKQSIFVFFLFLNTKFLRFDLVISTHPQYTDTAFFISILYFRIARPQTNKNKIVVNHQESVKEIKKKIARIWQYGSSYYWNKSTIELNRSLKIYFLIASRMYEERQKSFKRKEKHLFILHLRLHVRTSIIFTYKKKSFTVFLDYRVWILLMLLILSYYSYT